jgi:cation:H+ antiporter
MEYIWLVVGFVLLVKGADYFVDGASSIAGKLKVPSLIIGLTVVSMGTSLPEAAVSISASLSGNNGISLGNVIGSNIANILLILGTCSTIAPLTMSGVTMVDVWVMVAAIAVLLFATLLLRARRISRVLALLLLVGYGLYMWYLLKA